MSDSRTVIYRWIAAGVAISSLLGSHTAVATTAWQPDLDSLLIEGKYPDVDAGDSILFIDEEGNDGGTVVVATRDGTEEPLEICAELGPELDCGTGELVDVGSQAILPVCTDQLENCIEALEVAGPDGEYKRATYAFTPGGTRFIGNPALGVPSGTLPSTFESEILNSESNQYTIESNMGFWLNAFSDNRREFNPDKFYVRIQPTKRISRPGTRQTTAFLTDTINDNGPGRGIGVEENQGCIYQDVDICGVAVDFSPSTSFRVTMVLTEKLTGWFRGRMVNPNISIEPAGPGYIRVSVSGAPVEVPRFAVTYSPRLGDPPLARRYAKGGSYTLLNSASLDAMDLVNQYRTKMNDTAVGVSTVWSMTSISGGQAAGNSPLASKCLESKSQLLGIVTTNSMTYTGSIPDFDLGYLSYKVAGLHHMPNGIDLAIGTYDMVMRSDTARCLYGFTKAPVSATVQVVGDQGAEKIATTIISEKDGWLKLAAYGFTFSEKEIRVKVTQPYSKTLTKFTGSTKALSSKQKAEVKATVAKAKSNPKFICTGTYVNHTSKATALARAKAACNYAKSLDKNHSYFAQAKQTSAKSYDGKVMLISK